MGRPMPQCERCVIRSYQTIEDEYAELNYNFRQIEDRYQLLLSALHIISTGIEYADGEPFIDGSTQKRQRLLNGRRMQEIAKDTLEAIK